MTPARFDILHLIHDNFRGKLMTGYGYRLGLAEITERLGLARQTIWKSVARLIELGFVTKEEDEFVRRHKTVRLTAAGLRTLRAAYYRVWSLRRLPRHYRAHFARLIGSKDGIPNTPRRVENGVKAFWRGLVAIARHLGNRADNLYAFRVREPCIKWIFPRHHRARAWREATAELVQRKRGPRHPF